MADSSARLHGDAVLAMLIDAGWVLNTTLFDGELAPETTDTPYTILWVPPGNTSETSLRGDSDQLDTVVQLTHVGGDRNEAIGESDAARLTIVDKRPALAGRTAYRIKQAGDGGPVTRDDASRIERDSRPAFSAIAFYRVTSLPA